MSVEIHLILIYSHQGIPVIITPATQQTTGMIQPMEHLVLIPAVEIQTGTAFVNL